MNIQKAPFVKAALVVGTAMVLVPGANSVYARQANTEVVHLVYWNMWTGNVETLINQIVQQFNKTHPDIQVSVVSVPDDGRGGPEAKFLAAEAAGDAPDVMTEWNWVMPTWAHSGAILNLEPYISKYSPGLKKWLYPSVKSLGQYDGKMYSLPWTVNSYQLYYNKDMMKAAGFNPNQPPKTISELDAIQAKEWKFDTRGYIQQMGFVPNWMTGPWAAAFGTQWVNAKGVPTPLYSNNLKEAEWFATYEKKYSPGKVASFNSEFNASNNNGSDPFVAGKEGFLVQGPWELSQLKQYAPNLHFGVAPIPFPQGYGNPNVTEVDSNFNIIAKASKHPQQAFEFVLWLEGYKNESYAAHFMTEGGWMPPSASVASQPEFKKWVKSVPGLQGFVNVLTSQRNFYFPQIRIQQYYHDQIANAEQEIMTGKQTPEQALRIVNSNVQQELANTK